MTVQSTESRLKLHGEFYGHVPISVADDVVNDCGISLDDLIIPAPQFRGILVSLCPSVPPSLRPSICPSVKPENGISTFQIIRYARICSRKYDLIESVKGLTKKYYGNTTPSMVSNNH